MGGKAPLDGQEQSEQRDRPKQLAEGAGRTPPIAGSSHQGIDEQDQRERDRHCSGNIVRPGAIRAMALEQSAGSGKEDKNSDRHIDKENPAPTRSLGEQATQDDPDGSPSSGNGTPHGQGAIACCPFSEGDKQDREGSRCDDRSTEALHPPGHLQHE